jgi:hypothetical protein
MEKLLAPIITILVFAFIFLLSKLMEFYRDRSLRELVAWSVSTDNHARCNLSLSEYIIKTQNKLSLPQEHRVSGSAEIDYMKAILTEYQRYLTQSYFNGYLKVIKSKYVIQGEDYFMFSLYTFLSEHQCDYEFIEQDMHKQRISYKEYGSWSVTHFDATYSLTDFAVVFHKMHYITYMYCRNNEILKALVPAWNEKTLKEILDTKQLQVSRY